jgi:hypothetical protein
MTTLSDALDECAATMAPLLGRSTQRCFHPSTYAAALLSSRSWSVSQWW